MAIVYARCSLVVLLVRLFSASVAADEWPQWRGLQADGTWNETGLVEKFSGEQLDLLWSAEVGPGYTGPTVADGRVYLMDRQTEPRNPKGLSVFRRRPASLFGSTNTSAPTVMLATKPALGASVTIVDDQAFSLGTMGHLHCFDAATGEIRWKRDLNREYEIQRDTKENSRMPIWGIAASPLIYKDTVILHIWRTRWCVCGVTKPK